MLGTLAHASLGQGLCVLSLSHTRMHTGTPHAHTKGSRSSVFRLQQTSFLWVSIVPLSLPSTGSTKPPDLEARLLGLKSQLCVMLRN